MNVWFVEAIWLYFYRLFMNDAQIGILDATAFAVGLIAEIPSGALADRFGRSKIVKLGIVLAAVGIAGQAFGGFSVILFFQSLAMIGFAFMSGADEALFFEKLRFKKDSVEWRKLMTRAGQVAYTSAIIGIPLGSVIYGLNHESAFILNGAVMLASGLALLNIRDVAKKGSMQSHGFRESFHEYISDIANGFRAFRAPRLKLYIPIIIVAQGLLYIFSWGLLKLVLMDRFGYSEQFGGILMSIGGIIVIIILHVMNRYAERLHEKRIISLLSMSLVWALFTAIPGIPVIGLAVIVILYAADGILYPFISEVLHKHASDENRATVVSVASFLKTVPYVVMAPLIGWLNSIGRLDIFLVSWAILIVIAWLYYATQKKRDTILHVDFE